MSKQVIVERTGKGLKLSGLIAFGLIIGGLWKWFVASEAKDGGGKMLGLAIFFGGIALWVLNGMIRWWRHG